MAITVRATKKGRFGGPAVQIAYDPGTKLDEILDAQKKLFADKGLARKIGLKFCPGCYSGLDLDILQQFENVVQF
ncbi:MAG: hypothetical protein R2762_18885 [Bryobacteraceae bacterium]